MSHNWLKSLLIVNTSLVILVICAPVNREPCQGS